jgi:hypothetical protein
VKSVHDVLRSQGRYFMLCFSDKEPRDWGGPRRIKKEEILQAFSQGWRVDAIRPVKFESTYHDDGGEAWFSSITRVN